LEIIAAGATRFESGIGGMSRVELVADVVAPTELSKVAVDSAGWACIALSDAQSDRLPSGIIPFPGWVRFSN
jgi:hypothetical protein